ncbi:hypothetical protein AB6D99_20885 [Vibrio cyclitrophicus]
MDTMNLKYLVIYAISWTVQKFPACFSKKHKFISESFFYRTRDKKDTPHLKSYAQIKTYSLFDPRCKWKAKAISSIYALSLEQTNKIHTWKATTDLYRNREKDEVSITGNGTFNLGFFFTDSSVKYFGSAERLAVTSPYIHRADVKLISLEGGLSYLSIYWYLNDDATALIKDVDISNLDNEEVTFLTCNPFNKLYGSSSLSSKLNTADKLLSKNLRSLFEDMIICEKALKKHIGLETTALPITTLDVHVKETEPYFLKHVESKEEVSTTEAPTRRIDEVSFSRLSMPFSRFVKEEDHEFLIEHEHRTKIPFNKIFIKSQVYTECGDFGFSNFENNGLHVNDSHLIFSILTMYHNAYRQWDSKYRNYVLSSSSDPVIRYTHLYHAYLEINDIERSLNYILKPNSLMDFKFHGADKYLESFKLNTEFFLKEVTNTRKDIEQKKHDANELVQAGNLQYQKRNSWLVTALALLQVLLAVIALEKMDISDITSSLFLWFQ